VCNGHGTCDQGTGTCACESPWTGKGCQWSGVTACEPPDAAAGKAGTCNGHGTCDDSSGFPVCTCYPGYLGLTCDAACPTNPATGDVCSTVLWSTTSTVPAYRQRSAAARHAACELDDTHQAVCIPTSSKYATASDFRGGCPGGMIGVASDVTCGAAGGSAACAAHTPAGGAITAGDVGVSGEYYEGLCRDACPVDPATHTECGGNGMCVRGVCLCNDVEVATHTANTTRVSAQSSSNGYIAHGVTFCSRVTTYVDHATGAVTREPTYTAPDGKVEPNAVHTYACSQPVYMKNAAGYVPSKPAHSVLAGQLAALQPGTALAKSMYGPMPYAGTFMPERADGFIHVATNLDSRPVATLQLAAAVPAGAVTSALPNTQPAATYSQDRTSGSIHCFGNGTPMDCGECACLEGYDPLHGCQLCAPGYATELPLATAKFAPDARIKGQNPHDGTAAFVFTFDTTANGAGFTTAVEPGCKPCIFASCKTVCEVYEECKASHGGFVGCPAAALGPAVSITSAQLGHMAAQIEASAVAYEGATATRPGRSMGATTAACAPSPAAPRSRAPPACRRCASAPSTTTTTPQAPTPPATRRWATAA
jgi:hypothetical protein